MPPFFHTHIDWELRLRVIGVCFPHYVKKQDFKWVYQTVENTIIKENITVGLNSFISSTRSVYAVCRLPKPYAKRSKQIKTYV
jgi:hypothetical protein